jgi:hypothetical protein
LDSIVIRREKKEATCFSKSENNPSKCLILQMAHSLFQVILDSTGFNSYLSIVISLAKKILSRRGAIFQRFLSVDFIFSAVPR